jgi:ribonuclease P protein component
VEGKNFRPKRGLDKANRLVGETAFREVIYEGRRWESPELKVYVLEGKRGPACLGIVVGRKSGTAVRRNRFKRRVREAVRQHRAFAKGVRLVVVAKQGALDLSYAEIAGRLDLVFGRHRSDGEEYNESG